MSTTVSGLVDLLEFAASARQQGLNPLHAGAGLVNLAVDGESVSAHVLLPQPDESVVVGFAFLRAGPDVEPVVVDVLVHRLPEHPVRSVTAKGVRDLPLGELMSRARQLATERLRGYDARGTGADAGPATNEVRDAAELLDDDDLRALSVWKEDRRGRGRRSDGDYAVLAVLFASLRKRGVRNAAQVLGDATDASARVTSDRLRKARQLDLLDGDEWTAKAWSLAAPLLGAPDYLH